MFRTLFLIILLAVGRAGRVVVVSYFSLPPGGPSGLLTSDPRVLEPAAEVEVVLFRLLVNLPPNVMSSMVSPNINMSSGEERLTEDGALEQDERRGAKRKMSLSNCGVCGAGEARYTCPACRKHSCSVMCVKKHKKQSGCSGLRDKTAFVGLSEFDELNLLNDYRFLEDTSRMSGSSSRDPLIRAPHISFKAKKLTACAKKMNITLKFLPVTFTKSRENSTMFFTKEKRFLWHLKLIFPQSDAQFSERRVSDGQSITQILTPYVHPSESDPVTRQKLKMYAQATFNHMKVFLRAEGERANSLRYYELDLGKSLRDNFSYKMLIEYPELHIVLQGHFQDYPLKAEPGSDRTEEEVQETNKVAQALPSSPEPGRSSPVIKQEGSDGIKPPQEEPAKRREEEEEEKEEGELTEGSEGEQGENHQTEDKSLFQTCSTVADDAVGPVNAASNAVHIQESSSGHLGCEGHGRAGEPQEVGRVGEY
ncbi:hypothetical protein NHX12_032945 [Muraenolepis orangiensis]|uniref:HIT-type domain-containing protein n=1 Tax=Muraenolepis orangiensis TaxID=630683 RepID=A0A9Q0E6P2_9TELE|nr:hypothetical protein NHX12_032945 [Muraenolepis orangiensis]